MRKGDLERRLRKLEERDGLRESREPGVAYFSLSPAPDDERPECGLYAPSTLDPDGWSKLASAYQEGLQRQERDDSDPADAIDAITALWEQAILGGRGEV